MKDKFYFWKFWTVFPLSYAIKNPCNSCFSLFKKRNIFRSSFYQSTGRVKFARLLIPAISILTAFLKVSNLELCVGQWN